MSKLKLRHAMAALFVMAVAACGGTPYTPVVSQTDKLDPADYARKADNFVVLLDTSGSMNTADAGNTRMKAAQDWTASFNSAVPPLDFKAGLITFGKGATGSCIGYGIPNTMVGLSAYNSTEFANALGSLKCAASTTPIAAAIDETTTMLAEDQGLTAVIIVSDFNFNDPDAVQSSLAALKAMHPNNICVHTVKIGSDTAHDGIIAGLTDTAGCDSAVNASDVASGPALSKYVAATLLTPLERALQYTTHTLSAEVLFDFDKSVVKEQGKVELQKLATAIRSQGLSVGDIDVIGHTDSVGSDQYNQALSVRRAMAVKAYIVQKGINPGIIDAIGMGERQPAATNETAAGRAQNRRVEIRVGTKKPAQ
jgi:OOP family OmpA-OmpF porin